MGCHSLLQGIFPTEGLNLGLLHYRQILYHLSHQGRSLHKIYTLYKKKIQCLKNLQQLCLGKPSQTVHSITSSAVSSSSQLLIPTVIWMWSTNSHLTFLFGKYLLVCFSLAALGPGWATWDLFTVAHGFCLEVCRLSCPITCGIWVPLPGIKPMSPALQGRFLTTGPPGNSLTSLFRSVKMCTTRQVRLCSGKFMCITVNEF